MRFQTVHLRGVTTWGNILALIGVALIGCQDDARPARLQGEIEYLAQPIEEGTIRLFPIDGTPGKGAAAVIAAGRYQFPAEKSLTSGVYRVEMSATRATGKTIAATDTAGEEVVTETTSYLPEIFRSRSVLKIELQPGENQRSFRLAEEGEMP